MLNKRYLYNTTAYADYWHDRYRGSYTETLKRLFGRCEDGEYRDSDDAHYHRQFIEIAKCFPGKSLRTIEKTIIKLVRVLDLNMLYCSYNADETAGNIITYKEVIEKTIKNKLYNKKLINFCHMLSHSGQLHQCILYAQYNRERKHSPSKYFIELKRMASDPTHILYNENFVKDFAKVCHPDWLTHKLNKDEMQDLFSIWTYNNRGEMPNRQSRWEVPKNHSLYRTINLGYKLTPSPYIAMVDLGKVGKMIASMEHIIKQNKKPDTWNAFAYNYPEEAEKLEKKYPHILTQYKWLKTNLTPTQQDKYNRWKSFEELVFKYNNTNELLTSINEEERRLLGNQMKSIVKFNETGGEGMFHYDKQYLRERLFDIFKRVINERSDLVEFYQNDKGVMDRSTFYRIQEHDKNFNKILNKGKQGKTWDELTEKDRMCISALTRINGVARDKYIKQLNKYDINWLDKEVRNEWTKQRYREYRRINRPAHPRKLKPVHKTYKFTLKKKTSSKKLAEKFKLENKDILNKMFFDDIQKIYRDNALNKDTIIKQELDKNTKKYKKILSPFYPSRSEDQWKANGRNYKAGLSLSDYHSSEIEKTNKIVQQTLVDFNEKITKFALDLHKTKYVPFSKLKKHCMDNFSELNASRWNNWIYPQKYENQYTKDWFYYMNKPILDPQRPVCECCGLKNCERHNKETNYYIKYCSSCLRKIRNNPNHIKDNNLTK